MYRIVRYNFRTIGALALTVRWLAVLLVCVEWVQSQLLKPNSDVDSSYNFYFEQPCCTGPVTKSKYHARHRRVVSHNLILRLTEG
ncbi:unnamed protein product [Leptidea sinapis]|uniref:Uncharacterized protein n=1 Tax=Leptidea sinapis TaxID=189913 RepID=A0A5E4Q593_9NEOP|nr:unnamed protein product [Leptidea sinapis]